ncbi:MAG: DNA glycosylase AlkZ-like family protein [Candidatus Kariarchaeaceae archaeon]
MEKLAIPDAKRIIFNATAIYSNEKGEKGIINVFEKLKSIQLDTLPIVGRNHDLVFQSRMDDYKEGEFLEYAHNEKIGFEYVDKALCMIKIEDFPLFYSFMKKQGMKHYSQAEEKIREEHPDAYEEIVNLLKEKEVVSSKEFEDGTKLILPYMGFKTSKVGGMMLDCLWNKGEAVIHHREKYRRYYSFPARRIPEKFLEEEEITMEEIFRKMLIRRIEQLGILAMTNNAETLGLVRGARKEVKGMIKRGEIKEIKVEGKERKYLTTEKMLKKAEENEEDERIRFIAPLDPLVWDRRLVKEIFEYDYIWEVYKPVKKRKYGYYCLPVFYKGEFIGRIDPKINRKNKRLEVKEGLWEDGKEITEEVKEKAGKAIRKLAKYLNVEEIIFEGKNKEWKEIIGKKST